ncbi:MAG TPA: beta-ketoacyl-[acyl-carrier-protein] synthase family protein [Tepidisphaeraceae bacterium]|nr:beta-ketoacyl-[acyl-carrier-protein] synthase family protein [Tepidisphaeraceae bacterium]
MNSSSTRRVVVTGIGIVSPLGIGARAFWDALLAGQSGISRISSFDPSHFPSQLAGQVPPYKINDFVPKTYRKATKVMARDTELAVIAADDAFKDSGLQSKAHAETPSFNPTRFGCNIGAALISADLAELTAAMHVAHSVENPEQLDLNLWGTNGMSQLTPLWLLKYLPNMLASHVTIIHELRGPSNNITCQDASSHLSIGEAFRILQRGDADLAIAGGAESRINHMGVMRQSLLNRLNTTNNDSPATAVRPFDSTAAGTIVGEGGALLILEEYQHAVNRNAKIYAELVGFGASQDSYKVTDPAPDGRSYANAISKALKDANLPPAAVDCFIPHGLGIPSHDRAELAALNQVFGAGLSKLPLAPIKSQIGNLAAGCAVDAAAAILSLHHNQLPPSPNTKTPLDNIPLNTSPTPRNQPVNVAISSVYSLGGQNAALVFKKI